VSRQDLEEQKQRLIKVHGAFKDLVVRGRPGIVEHIDTVTDGTVFLGVEAKELALVDDVMTSDAYILERITAGDRVLRLHRSMQTRFSSRQRRITLIDLIPHLRDQCTRWIRDEKTMVQRVIQMGTWIGFLRHLFQKYGFQL
jgi:ClpP class serine protease